MERNPESTETQLPAVNNQQVLEEFLRTTPPEHRSNYRHFYAFYKHYIAPLLPMLSRYSEAGIPLKFNIIDNLLIIEPDKTAFEKRYGRQYAGHNWVFAFDIVTGKTEADFKMEGMQFQRICGWPQSQTPVFAEIAKSVAGILGARADKTGRFQPVEVDVSGFQDAEEVKKGSEDPNAPIKRCSTDILMSVTAEPGTTPDLQPIDIKSITNIFPVRINGPDLN